MHNLDITFHFIRRKELIGFSLGGCENNGLTKSTVNQENIGEGLHPVVEGTVDRNMVNIFLGLIFQVFGEINLFPIFLKISVCHVFDPSWNSGRKQKKLRCFLTLLFDVDKNPVNILFETELKHLICLVEDQRFELTKI